MPKIKPFEIPWTPVHNYVFDRLMPKLSPNAWKVLCVAIRQTLGWEGAGPGGRRKWDAISYSQFMEKAGIGSRATIRKAIRECLDAGYLLRRQVGTDPRSARPLFAYALNTDFTAEVEPSGTETVLLSGTETVLTKERETNKKESDDGGSSEKLAQKLIALKVHEGQARKWATLRPPAMVLGWIEYIRRNGHSIHDVPAFLVAKLRDGEEPPAMHKPEDDRRRYIEGPYAHLIQH